VSSINERSSSWDLEIGQGRRRDRKDPEVSSVARTQLKHTVKGSYNPRIFISQRRKDFDRGRWHRPDKGPKKFATLASRNDRDSEASIVNRCQSGDKPGVFQSVGLTITHGGGSLRGEIIQLWCSFPKNRSSKQDVAERIKVGKKL